MGLVVTSIFLVSTAQSGRAAYSEPGGADNEIKGVDATVGAFEAGIGHMPEL